MQNTNLAFSTQSLFDKTASSLANQAECDRFHEVRARRDIAEWVIADWQNVGVVAIRRAGFWFSRS